MARNKKEAVTVSFHYLCREIWGKSQLPEQMFFRKDEFNALAAKLTKMPRFDLGNDAAKKQAISSPDVPIELVQQVNPRTLFGVFHSHYSGHAYQNTAKGKIPASSVSLRPFHFLLYLSEKGAIYVGCQYLGLFGGYASFMQTIRKLLPAPDNIVSYTYRSEATLLKDARPTTVRVEFARRADQIASKNVLGSGGMLAFKKEKGDERFEIDVKDNILALLGRPKAEIKKALSKLLSKNNLLAVKDDDIEDCSVIARINGRNKTIYMLEEGQFSTKFPINPKLTLDGHPDYEDAKTKMLSILKTEIISRSGNV